MSRWHSRTGDRRLKGLPAGRQARPINNAQCEAGLLRQDAARDVLLVDPPTPPQAEEMNQGAGPRDAIAGGEPV
jgi:hypothetical protein